MIEYEKDDITVRVDGGLKWPNVYSPEEKFQVGSTTAGGKFAASFPAADLADADAGLPEWVKIGKGGLVRARSNLRPEVATIGSGELRWLVEELARLDARNLSRDRVFDGHRADVVVRPYDYDFRGTTGTALFLVSVKVYI